MSQLESYELMQMLIPDGEVEKYAKATGLHKNTLYGERKRSGNKFADTGNRNTVDRLDLFCELTLPRNPIIVRMLGERYLNMYNNYIDQPDEQYTKADLLRQLGRMSKEFGEAAAALSNEKTEMKDCCVEVKQAQEQLEIGLRMFASILRSCQD